MNDIGGVRKEGSILVLLLGDPRYMHGLVKCTCFHKYVILHPGNFHGLINIWFVGAPHQMIPTFSMFQDEMELENFPREQTEYKYMENIMVLLQRADNRGGVSYGKLPTKKVSVLY